MQAIAIVVVLGVVFANLVADLLYSAVNPRIRYRWRGWHRTDFGAESSAAAGRPSAIPPRGKCRINKRSRFEEYGVSPKSSVADGPFRLLRDWRQCENIIHLVVEKHPQSG